MNVYRVTGQVQTEVDCHFDGWEYHPLYQYFDLDLTVEAKDPQEALSAALMRFTFLDAHYADFEWKERTKPNVEFVREISEAEMMERLGAPKLF